MKIWRRILRVFSLHFGENFLVSHERKYLSPIIYFSSSLLNQTHSKKIFLSILSPKICILSVTPPIKRTQAEPKSPTTLKKKRDIRLRTRRRIFPSPSKKYRHFSFTFLVGGWTQSCTLKTKFRYSTLGVFKFLKFTSWNLVMWLLRAFSSTLS